MISNSNFSYSCKAIEFTGYGFKVFISLNDCFYWRTR